MNVDVTQHLFPAAMLIREADMVEVNAPVRTSGSGRSGPFISGSSFKTSAIRLPLAALMVIITNTIESIINDMSTLMT